MLFWRKLVIFHRSSYFLNKTKQNKTKQNKIQTKFFLFIAYQSWVDTSWTLLSYFSFFCIFHFSFLLHFLLGLRKYELFPFNIKEEKGETENDKGGMGEKDLQLWRKENDFPPSKIFPFPSLVSPAYSPISYSLLAFSLGNTGREIVCERQREFLWKENWTEKEEKDE